MPKGLLIHNLDISYPIFGPSLNAPQWKKPQPRSARSLSKIRQIYCRCAGCGQIFRSFSRNIEKGRQLRARAFGVLTYSVYAPRAKSPAACWTAPRLREGMLFEHSPFSLNSRTLRLKRSKYLTQTNIPSSQSLISDRLPGLGFFSIGPSKSDPNLSAILSKLCMSRPN